MNKEKDTGGRKKTLAKLMAGVAAFNFFAAPAAKAGDAPRPDLPQTKSSLELGALQEKLTGYLESAGDKERKIVVLDPDRLAAQRILSLQSTPAAAIRDEVRGKTGNLSTTEAGAQFFLSWVQKKEPLAFLYSKADAQVWNWSLQETRSHLHGHDAHETSEMCVVIPLNPNDSAVEAFYKTAGISSHDREIRLPAIDDDVARAYVNAHESWHCLENYDRPAEQQPIPSAAPGALFMKAYAQHRREVFADLGAALEAYAAGTPAVVGIVRELRGISALTKLEQAGRIPFAEAISGPVYHTAPALKAFEERLRAIGPDRLKDMPFAERHTLVRAFADEHALTIDKFGHLAAYLASGARYAAHLEGQGTPEAAAAAAFVRGYEKDVLAQGARITGPSAFAAPAALTLQASHFGEHPSHPALHDFAERLVVMGGGNDPLSLLRLRAETLDAWRENRAELGLDAKTLDHAETRLDELLIRVRKGETPAHPPARTLNAFLQKKP